MSTPVIQLYIGDYLRDTQGLTTEGHGAYLLILFAMWNADGWVSADPKKLAQYSRMTPAKWAKIADDIMPLLHVENGMATQPRLLKELEKATGKSLKRSEAGKLGAEAKRLKTNKPPQANASAKQEAMLQHSSETIIHKEESKKKEPPADAGAADRSDRSQPASKPSSKSEPELPAWLDRSAWSAFVEMRKRKRAPVTPRAAALIVSRLDRWRQAGHDPTAILDKSTQNAWTDVYEPKQENGNGTGHRQNGKSQSTASRSFADTMSSLDGESFARGLFSEPGIDGPGVQQTRDRLVDRDGAVEVWPDGDPQRH